MNPDDVSLSLQSYVVQTPIKVQTRPASEVEAKKEKGFAGVYGTLRWDAFGNTCVDFGEPFPFDDPPDLLRDVPTAVFSARQFCSLIPALRHRSTVSNKWMRDAAERETGFFGSVRFV